MFGVERCFDHPITDRFSFQQGVGVLLGATRANMCISMSSMVEPSCVTYRPDPVHRQSLTIRMSSLYLFISCVTCANFEVSFMVRTFQAAVQIWCRL